MDIIDMIIDIVIIIGFMRIKWSINIKFLIIVNILRILGVLVMVIIRIFDIYV